MKKFILLLTLGVIGYASLATAQVKDKAFKAWSVYTIDIQGRKICYMVSFPKGKSGNYTKRDEPYFMVTYIGDDNAEVSTSSGYKYKDGSRVEVSIGNKKIEMFTGGELAWVDDSQADQEFISVMKKQNEMKIKGSSGKGSYSIDRYSLDGFSGAYDRMAELCVNK